jgi:soluble lytic murein transglycosylase
MTYHTCMRRWASAVLLVACGHRDGTTVPNAPIDAGRTEADASAVVTTERMAWPDAIRAERWADAATGLALAPDSPEVRLAKARVALATGKPADALIALDGLDERLPLLRDLVANMRREAWWQSGDFAKAAEAYGARRDAASLMRAAEAWEKVSDTARARATLDRVLTIPKLSRTTEERARARRFAITRLKDGDAAAGADARWLAIHSLDDKTFSEAADLLEKLGKLLTSDELLVRARTLADAGRVEDALRLVERASTRGEPRPLEVCRARADVLWRARTRYAEAALAYRTCSAMGGAHAAEDLFFAGRAFLRSNRDGEAVPILEAVIARFPRTTWADQAEFHIARIHALARHWKEAAAALDLYVQHWPTGKERREADRYRALAHLAARDDKKARKLLEDLSGGAEDPITAARWTNLAALAALRDGDKLHAMSRWADVARTRPLSYPALVARARLQEYGSAPPEPIEPPESGAREALAVELPPPIDMLHRIGFDAEAEDALREREAAVMAKVPARGTEALCDAYGAIGRAKRRFQLSLGLPATLIATAPGPKNTYAWECMFPRPHDDLVKEAALASRVDAELVWAVMRQESAFDPEVVSAARAVGLMQLLPETARGLATGMTFEESMLTNPGTNVRLGTRYLRELLDRFGESAALSVAAYNAGPEAIDRWLMHARGESLDIFVEAIPYVETRGYVARVLGNLARYAYLARGSGGVPAVALELPRVKPLKSE